MQPLATTRQVMTWLSICPADESTNSWQKRAYKAHTWAVLIINFTAVSAGLTFCMEFFQTDFDSSTFAFMAAAGECGAIYFWIVAFQMRRQIDEIFKKLSTIYNDSESTQSGNPKSSLKI